MYNVYTLVHYLYMSMHVYLARLYASYTYMYYCIFCRLCYVYSTMDVAAVLLTHIICILHILYVYYTYYMYTILVYFILYRYELSLLKDACVKYIASNASMIAKKCIEKGQNYEG